MKRFRSEFALAALVALVSAGCAFEEGETWATATFGLAAELDPDGRLTDGRFRTTKEYDVELDEVTVVVGAMSVAVGAAEAVSFDPANPPAGYSLCHNGHCHSADGRLVDYEDIAAELGGSAAGAEVTATVNDSLDVVAGDRAAGSCEGACELPRGAVTQASVVVRIVRLRGTAWDIRSTDPRLPTEGVEFDWEVPVDTTFSTPLDAEIGKEFGGDVAVDGSFVVSAQVLDAIDFETGLDEPEFVEAFNEDSLFEASLNDGEVR